MIVNSQLNHNKLTRCHIILIVRIVYCLKRLSKGIVWLTHYMTQNCPVLDTLKYRENKNIQCQSQPDNFVMLYKYFCVYNKIIYS